MSEGAIADATIALAHEDDDPTDVLADADVALVAPASHSQRRVWFFEQLGSGSAVYNIVHAEMLMGPLDATALQRTLDEMIRRHEALRTTFRNFRGTPFQVVWHPRAARIARFDVTGRPAEARDRDVQRLFEEEAGRGFDLERGPLTRYSLIEIESRRQMLVVVFHHTIFDLLSVGIFSREFKVLYDDFKQGRGASLPEPDLRYSAYIAAQNLRFETQGQDPQVAYWAQKLAHLPAISELPPDKPRPPVQTYPGAMKVFRIAPEIASSFLELTRNAKVTLFMSVFAVYAVLLHRCSGQDDLAVGTPIANRGKSELEGMLGFLLNMLVLRIDLSDDPTVNELLARAKAVAVEAFDNQDVPFEVLIETLKPQRDPSRSPFFQTMFIIQSGQVGIDDDEEKHVPWIGAKYDLTLIFKEAGSALWATFEYNTDLFEAGTIDRLAAQFQSVMASMAVEPAQQRVSQVVLLDEKSRREIVEAWNTTRALPPTADGLHHLFERCAAARPDAVAVSYGVAKLTYGELDRRADALADVLRKRGVGAEVCVGICMERSLEWIIAIFATLKAGGAIVPLDVAFPPARLAFMIEDAGAVVVLTQSQFAGKLSDTGVPRLFADEPLPDEASRRSSGPASPGDLAYVVYTSGSTGRPKGVSVQHDSVVNFIRSQIEDWAIGPGARVLQFTAFGFDIGLSEIFLTLCSGAEFCLASDGDLRAGPPLMRSLRDLRITHVTLPPSALAAMQPESLPDLRLLISAGEPCEPDLARRWAQGRRIVNAYGPTEATIYATIGDFNTATGRFPLGRPIPNVQVYVLDRHGVPVPPGVTGEIHIGGIGVARGYLNRPELTAERFIPNSFSEDIGARLYRTGDLGRFDAAGTLHYLGRADVQLKVRGYRIEPGEIESVMRQHPQVRDAVVVSHGLGPEARLVAYYIAEGTPPLIIELRSFLARLLPDYMSPAAYIQVEAWPKNANGKIDRAALPRPESFAREVEAHYVAPGSATEAAIAMIWRECLGIERVGTSDNFFDLGGHSLLLVRVHDLLNQTLKTDLSLIDMFRLPTIKLLAAAVEAKTSKGSDVETLGRTDVRAARQNAARQQRRQRIEVQRHA